MSLADVDPKPALADAPLGGAKDGRFPLFLTHAAVCAILMPVGAQSSIATLLVLHFLWQRGFRKLSGYWQHAGNPPLREFWRRFFLTLCLVWGIQFLSLIVELLQVKFALPVSREAVVTHLRNLGKWGIYGCLVVSAFQLQGMKRALGTKEPRAPGIKVQPILIFTALYALYMIGQRFYGWDWVHGWDARLGENRFAYGVYRGSGLMGHPLTLAYNAMIFCLLSFCHGLWLWDGQRREAKLWLLQAGLLLYIIILSGSRYPAFLTLLLLLAGLFATRRKGQGRWILLAGGLSGVGLLFGLSLLDPNLQGRLGEIFMAPGDLEERFDRLVFWKVHLEMIRDHPWFGVGFGHYKDILSTYYQNMGYSWVLNKYNAHNIYLQIGAQTGFLGLVTLGMFLWAFLRLALSVYARWRHLGLLFLTLGTVLGGIMQNTLQDSEYLFLLWFSLGLCMTWFMDRMATEEKRES